MLTFFKMALRLEGIKKKTPEYTGDLSCDHQGYNYSLYTQLAVTSLQSCSHYLCFPGTSAQYCEFGKKLSTSFDKMPIEITTNFCIDCR